MEHLRASAATVSTGRAPGYQPAGAVAGMRVGNRVSRRLYYFALIVLALYSLGPLVVFLFTALKSQSELATNPLGPPHHWVWSNFVQAWDQGDIGSGLKNGAILTIGTALGVCVIAGLAAHAMARLDLPGTNGVILYLIAVTVLPIQLFLVPLFELWSRLHLYNTLIGLMIVYWAVFSPFATLLLRSFMVALPHDFEDAARIDGAGELGVLWRVTVPLVAPGFLTVALVSGLAAWNQFLLAVTFLQSPNLMPISLSLFQFQQGYTQNYPLVSAAAVFMLVPMIVLFLALQRRFVAGLSVGGLGG
jgi:raffinose/stachyose/melibiose transport system permease protein